MTMSIWERLGIERTDDPKAIKRGYAAKLKTTNPEDDPEGFQALRAAYEQALEGDSHTTWVVAKFQPPELTPEPEPEPAPQTTPEPAPAADITAKPVAEEPSADPRQVHTGLKARLEAALFSARPDNAALVAAWEAVLASPALDLVDIYTGTEDWLMHLIARNIPRSDVLIPLAVKHYGWKDHALRVRESQVIERILLRQKDLSFLAHIRTEVSQFHRAYLILSAPSQLVVQGQRLTPMIAAPEVARLLEIIRDRHPSVMVDLHVETVDQWCNYLARPDEVPFPPFGEGYFEATAEIRQDHATLQADLERALNADTPDEAAILAAFQAVMTSPGIELIDVYAATEDWLKKLIAGSIPRSDPLIHLAVNHYHWDNRDQRRRLRVDGPDLIAAILTRLRNLDFLTRIRKTSSDYHRAYRILTLPPVPFSLWRQVFPAKAATQVSDLLELIRAHYPQVIADMNGDSVRHWHDYLTLPRLGKWGQRSLMMTPFCLVLMGLGFTFLPLDMWALCAPLMLPPAYTCLSGGVVYGFNLPQRLWQARGGNAPAWLRFGWAPAVVALLALAALPASPWSTAIITLLSLAVASWVVATGEADTSEGKWPWKLRAAFSETYLLLWALIVLIVGAPAQILPMGLALIATVFVSAFGRFPLAQWFDGFPVHKRQAMGFVNVGLSLMAGALMFAVVPLHEHIRHAPFAGLAIAATAATTLLHRGLWPRMADWLEIVKRSSTIGLSLIGLVIYPDLLLVPTGLMLLSWVTVPTLVAMVKDNLPKRKTKAGK